MAIQDFLIEVQIRGLQYMCRKLLVLACESARCLFACVCVHVCVCVLVRDSCRQMAQTEGPPRKSSYCVRIVYSRDLKSPDLRISATSTEESYAVGGKTTNMEDD